MSRDDCQKKPRSGTIRIRWQTCPGVKCPSWEFEHWDVDYEGDDFWCGTCLVKLMRPVFARLNGKTHHQAGFLP